ncbi:MAG: septum site-determining protein MinC [Gammaproteobacteria bacterium]|nr:MAG: septum site-determining protein MinC [Gammaproteobacteria bacterium]
MNAQTDPMTDTPAFDMKAGQYTLPSLLIRRNDPDELDRYLGEQVARLPRFFEQAPLVIDLSRFEGDEAPDFPVIVGMIRAHGMVPVGVRAGTQEQIEQARLLELAVMPRLKAVARRSTTAAPAARHEPLVIEQPVRSGQRIYAEGTDLVLCAGVSSGAEVMADGHIHAWGPVRGRILAGVRENPEARIFCRDLGAELVAIAGRYLVSEDLPAAHLGHSVRIALRGDRLEFTSI